ncbi:MAG: dTDP-4-dehydrorhamnose 3,5-epimerase [Phycisphaerae bacterium]|nr:dTDP-4-dehydrorhamnose 3,5-epimerase [Phycisphaerae bacterium]
MNIIKTEIDGVIILEPRVFEDDRGYFLETWSIQRYKDAGIDPDFVQDNVSFSSKGTLRGLHFQNPNCQGKLVQALSGTVLDIAVDIRVGSDTFGKSVSVELSECNHRQMYIPPGFAHGFCVLSESALFSYKCTELYDQSAEGGVLWNDPDLGLDWQINEPLLSPKDLKSPQLKDIPEDKLPRYGGV